MMGLGDWGDYEAPNLPNLPKSLKSPSRLMLATAMQGNVRSLTMRAFSETEMENIVQGLP
jgi:uncharacterized protein with GYD domain